MAWMICLKSTRALGWMFLLITVPILLLYMAYYWAPGGNAAATMRFLLPTFPFYLLGGMWMLHTATRSSPRGVAVVLPIVLVLFQVLWGFSETMQRVDRMAFSKRALTTITEAARAHTQTGDVVVTTTAFLQHADFVREWKLADLSLVSGRGGGPGGPGRRMDANGNAPSPMQLEKQQMLRGRYVGSTSEKLAKFASDVVKWAGPERAVYVICSESELRSVLGRDNPEVQVLETLALPKRPMAESAARGAAGPGGGMRPPGGGMGGPGGGGPGGGGGMFGLANLDGATWVIARWTPNAPPTTSPAGVTRPAP